MWGVISEKNTKCVIYLTLWYLVLDSWLNLMVNLGIQEKFSVIG
jgi:hypothetical protein